MIYIPRSVLHQGKEQSISAQGASPAGERYAQSNGIQNAPSMQSLGIDDNVLNKIRQLYLEDAKPKYNLSTDFERMQAGSIPVSWDKKYTNSEMDTFLYENGLPSASEFSKYYEKALDSANTRQFDFSSPSFDQAALGTMAEDFKNSWTYDIFDAEDALRMEAGVMPKAIEAKYDLSDPNDQQLFERGLPYKSKFSTDYQKEFAIAKEKERHAKLLGDLERELFPAMYELQQAEYETAAAEGRNPRDLDWESLISEAIIKDEYADLAKNFVFPSSSDDKTGYDLVKDVVSERNAQEKAENNPLAITVDDIVSDFKTAQAPVKGLASVQTLDEPAAPEYNLAEMLTVIYQNLGKDENGNRDYSDESLMRANYALAELGYSAEDRQKAFTYGLGTGLDVNSLEILEDNYKAEEANILHRQEVKLQNETVKPYKELLSGSINDYSTTAMSTPEEIERATAGRNALIDNARSDLVDAGVVSKFEQDNILQRNNIPLPQDQLLQHYHEEIVAPNTLEVFDPANAEQMSQLQLMYDTDTRVQELPQTAALKAVTAAPVSGTYSMAQGIVGAGEAITAAIQGKHYVRPEWVDSMYNIGTMIRGFGTTDDYTVTNTMFNVGAEVTRMYLTAGLGNYVAGHGASLRGIDTAVTKAGDIASREGANALIRSYAGRVATNRMTPFILTATGNSYIQAMAQGATPEQAVNYAIIAGGAEGALETFGADAMFRKAFNEQLVEGMFRAGRETLSSPMAFKAAQILSSAIGNGLEEGASYVISGAAERLIYNPEWSFSSDEMLEEAFMGFLMGGIGSAAGSASDSQQFALFEYMAENGFTAKAFDDMFFATEVDAMPQARKENYSDAQAQALAEYKSTYDKLFQSTQSVENAKVNLDQATQRYEADLEKAESSLSEALVKMAALDSSDPDYAIKMKAASDEVASRQRTYDTTKETIEAKIAGATREYESISSNNKVIQKQAQRTLGDHALVYDLMRNLAEARSATNSTVDAIEQINANIANLDPMDLTGKEALYAQRAELSNQLSANMDAETNLARANNYASEQMAMNHIENLPVVDQIVSPENLENYRNQIDRVFSGSEGSGVIHVGDTPAVLLQHGAPDAPLSMTNTVARKIIEEHNLGLEALKQLPLKIADPVALLQSKSHGIIAVTDWIDRNGYRVIVPIHINKTGLMHTVENRIASAYGKRDLGAVLGENMENVLFARNKEDINQLFSAGLQLPMVNTDNALTNNIPQEAGINQEGPLRRVSTESLTKTPEVAAHIEPSMDTISQAEGDAQPRVEAPDTGISQFRANTLQQNLTGLLSGYDPAESIWDLLFNSATQFTPSGLGTISRIADPYERETYDPSDFAQAGNKVLARIPGLRQMLPERIGTDGQPIEAGGIGERALQNTLSPGYYAEATNDPVHRELYRLNEAGHTDQLLPVAEKKINGVPLTSDQYNEYQRELGQAVYGAAEKVMQGSKYVAANDEDRAKLIQKQVQKATQKVRDAWKDRLKEGA